VDTMVFFLKQLDLLISDLSLFASTIIDGSSNRTDFFESVALALEV
jgi:hypothetical protein